MPASGIDEYGTSGLEQLLRSKRGLRNLVGADPAVSRLLGENEPNMFPFTDKLQRKAPRLGGRREEHNNPAKTMPWLFWLVWNPTLLLQLSASPRSRFHPGGHVLHTADTHVGGSVLRLRHRVVWV